MSSEFANVTARLDAQSWVLLDRCVRRFEDAWKNSSPPIVADFLPPADSPLRQRVLIELIKIDQELRWQRREPALVESYLNSWKELNSQDTVVELLNAECLTRATVDQAPTAAELRGRFPSLWKRVNLADIEVEAGREKATRHMAYTGLPSHVISSGLLAGGHFGRYAIRSLVGSGGMGTVYRAFDTQLGREVALKVPNFDTTTDPLVLERFLREARAAAAIRHPNVCPVYDVGQIDGTYYISMALVEGQSLASILPPLSVPAEGAVGEGSQELAKQPLPLTQHHAGEITRKLALALAKVHAAGIIHRDIKPSNVMIDDSGEPLLMDFGLARQTQVIGPGEKQLSVIGSLIGTPAYMSPEQVAGDGSVVDYRSDIYSLGVLLYHMLAGRLPFSGQLAQVLVRIAESDPPAPCSIQPEVDRNLEAICLKAMAKRPADRYATATEVADALESYLRQKSGPAVSQLQRSRLPSWLASAGAALLLLAGTIIYIRTGDGTLVLEVNEPDVRITIDGRQVEIKSPRDLIVVSVPAGRHKLEVIKDGFSTFTDSFTIRRGGKVELAARLDASGPRTGKPAALPTELAAIAAKIDETTTTDPSDETVSGLRRELVTYAGRNRETPQSLQAVSLMSRLPWPADSLRREAIPPYELAVAGRGDPDAAHENLVAILGDSRLKHWSTGAFAATFSPDGTLVASAGGGDQSVAIWETATGRLRHMLFGHTHATTAVAFSPDGRTLGSGSSDGTVRLWDTETGVDRATIPVGPYVRALAFSPDRESLATRTLDGKVKLWIISTGGLLHEVKLNIGPVDQGQASASLLAFNHDGTLLASGSDDKTVKLWDTQTWEERTFEGHSNRVWCVAFNSMGTLLASGGDKTIRLWDIRTGEQRRVLKGHSAFVLSVAFAPDGRTLASSSADQTVRLWDTANGEEIRSLKATATNWVRSVAFSPDGRTLVTASNRGVMLWDIARGEEQITLSGHRSYITRAIFSPDGETLASASGDGTVRLWNVTTGQERAVISGQTAEVSSIAFSSNGKRLASASEDGTVSLWDASTGKSQREFRSTVAASSFVFSPDGKNLLSGNSDGTIRVWDVAQNRERIVFPAHKLHVTSLAFSPDGRTFASAGRDGNVELWDATTWQERAATAGHGHDLCVHQVAFAPDGTVFASVSDDATIKLWDATSVQLKATLKADRADVYSVAFSPDGKRFVSTGHDGSVQSWNTRTATLEQTLQLGPSFGRINHVSFSPEGRHIATANGNGTIYIVSLESKTPSGRQP